ncbi:hypothetical protein EV13_2772 [Prochlorococcus sp. MIT 0702]|nr:hypothetical protein EV12_2723 [Prochlorococcus sp. MIT 0701]KGG25996.1 hypothetical protein EV13_2772 [Prochlorococcus sp. MIT 0702]KGG30825.1 hypothetical protein EV14_2762 [Prochlorococcus sp. MIT 0703]
MHSSAENTPSSPIAAIRPWQEQTMDLVGASSKLWLALMTKRFG